MISFDFTNLYKVGENGVSLSELEPYYKQLGGFLERIENRNQDFYKMNSSLEWVKKIQEFAVTQEGKWERVAVLGIGGSALGTMFLREALGRYYGLDEKIKLHILDNVDPQWLKDFVDIADLSKTLFIVVTKSGGTPEILSQFSFFQKKVVDLGLDWKKHFVFVTDPKKGALRKLANEHKDIVTFEVPEKIGGRFSVLTPVGLVPAALFGIDIVKLLEGAEVMSKKFLSKKVEENSSFMLALIQYLLYKKRKKINVMMPYRQKLWRLADWYRQLLAESIGKKINFQGDEVNSGITPINARGVTDQHSQSQLYNEGPNDKLFMFIFSKDISVDFDIPIIKELGNSVDFLRGVTFEKLLKTELEATRNSLTENGRPNLLITLEKIDEFNLGEMIMLLEGSIAFLAEMLEVNAYNQPGVERSKILTKEYLE